MNLHPTPKSVARDTTQPVNSEAQDGPSGASVGSSTEKPCHRDEVADGARLPGTCHVTLCPSQWLAPCVWRGG
jgi:hypothetical protein